MFCRARLLVNLVRGVLRIIPSDIKEIADIVRLEDLEQPVHVLRGLFGLLLEIELVAAGAEGGGGRVLQPFDGFGLLVVEVDQLLAQDAVDAVETAVDFLNVLVPAGFLDDASDTRIDDCGRSTGLSDQEIAN